MRDDRKKLPTQRKTMAPEIQSVVRATQAWLQSSWHVQVPFAWLEACVEWLQEEAGGAGRLSQQQINQQVGRKGWSVIHSLGKVVTHVLVPERSNDMMSWK